MRTMVAREGENVVEGPQGSVASLHAAAFAAGLLAEAWSLPGSGDLPPRASVTRELASGLRTELEALAGPLDDLSAPDAAVEGAPRAADVANLAAASLAELPEANARKAAASAHLAAGAARALSALVGDAQTGGRRAEYALKDVRGAAWRAGLAARQADEALEGMEGSSMRKA